MEGPVSFWGYKEQESNLILPEHDDDDDDEYGSPLLLLGDRLVYLPVTAWAAGSWLAHFQWRLVSHGTEIYPQSWNLSSILKSEIYPQSRSQQGSGLRPLPCWDRGFESHRGHGYLSVVSVMCCQVEVSATSWSLVQRSPTDCGASLYVI